MDQHVKEFFSQSSDASSHGNFHKVIILHEEPKLDWQTVSKLVPGLCKGWYELAHLSSADRIGFSRDFWLAKFPYHPGLDNFLERFFDSLDDVIVFLTQQKYDDPYEAKLVYSLKDDNGFFHGSLPATDAQIANLQKDFPQFSFPTDYIAFLQIHDGFSKTTDCTGLTKSFKMKKDYDNFQDLLQKQEPIFTKKGTPVNPETLIPFYESFGMPFLQCFWAEWYPENEMGNVYYSSTTKTISDIESSEPSSESMAFPTFLDWLMFYMERVT